MIAENYLGAKGFYVHALSSADSLVKTEDFIQL